MKPDNTTFPRSDCAGRLCQADQLKQFVAQIFEAHGAPSDIAGEVARHLVRSDLSGHSSHGVIQVPHYILEVDRGELLPSARPAVVRETGITGVIDAKRGMGHFSTAFALGYGTTTLGYARETFLAVQLVAPPNDEATLLSLAAQLESERPWNERRPAL
jgi:LDH2 family malate/lactate/ureidoglycolate dehydrogenase